LAEETKSTRLAIYRDSVGACVHTKVFSEDDRYLSD
jgi:hypothetical protein